ncbi:MAG: serine/threonine-protein kinase [Gemmataceae bacterium]
MASAGVRALREKSTHVDNQAEQDSVPDTSPVIDPRQGKIPWGPAADSRSVLATPLHEGDLGALAGYRVLSELGSGGMGTVYRAIDPQLGRHVALKVMQPQVAQAARAQERFLREARAMAALQSDHVVSIYQVGEADGLPFLAMELLEGQSLQQWLDGGGRPNLPELFRLAREISVGLSAAHERGVIHRDIKPANLWLQSPIGRVKLLDFGLVRLVDDDARLTQDGCVVGTPHYMSPEQAAGGQLDARSDLFSLGCVLYRLCTGRIAFEGNSTLAVLNSLATFEPVPPRQLNADIPEELSALVMQMLAKRPEERPRSAHEVVERIYRMEQSYLASSSRIFSVMPSLPPTAAPASPAAPASHGFDPRWCWLLGWIALLNAVTLILMKVMPSAPPHPPPHLLPHVISTSAKAPEKFD